MFSDGTTTPAENAALAAREGLAGFALTDHDTVAGWEQAMEACARHRLTFVPGIELSTEEGGFSVHVLGYWCDPGFDLLADECHRLRAERSRRAEQILERLAALGVACSLERVLAHAAGAPVGRPHIAAAMVDAGVVPDVRTAFDLYLGDGAPAYVPKRALPAVDGVRLIRAAGGAAVLAHPGLESRGAGAGTALAERLAAAGLAGVEADHPAHDAETAAFWRAFARERGLVATAASDFHGDRKDARIGERATPVRTIEALREAATAMADPPAAAWSRGRKEATW